MSFARFIVLAGLLVVLADTARASNHIADPTVLCQANLPVGSTMVPVSFSQVVVEYDPALGLPPLEQERYACVFLPSTYNSAAIDNRAVFFFHGGNGFAGKLINGKDNIRFAEQYNYIAVFAQGWPKDVCTTDLCTKNSWSGMTDINGTPIDLSPINVAYAKQVIELAVVDHAVSRDHLFLAGFSGGAKLIYQMLARDTEAAPNGFTPRAIATAAGTVVSANITFPGMDPTPVTTVDLHIGKPQTPLMMLHGGKDTRMPIRGGFDKDRKVVRASFRTKVDMARLMNDARMAGITPVPLPGNYAAMVPANVPTKITEYNGAELVVAIRSATLKHEWPIWFAPIVFQFFDGY